MSDNLIEEILRQADSGHSPLKRKKFPSPLSVVTAVLGLALVAAVAGLILQQREHQRQMTQLEAEHSQTLQAMDADYAALAAAAQAADDALNQEVSRLEHELEQLQVELLYEADQSLIARSKLEGVIQAELVIRLFEDGLYQHAADLLNTFPVRGYELPTPQGYIVSSGVPDDPAVSAVFTFETLALYDPRLRLLEVAQALLDMGLVDQTCLDYVSSLGTYEFTINTKY